MTSSNPRDRSNLPNQGSKWSVDRKRDDLEQIHARVEFDEAIAAGTLPGPNSSKVDPAFGAVIRLLHGCLSPVEPEDQDVSRGSWQLPNPFGRFEVYEKIGEGAFGAVWKAFDPQLQRIIAIKVLHPELRVAPSVSHRFVKEARAAARLNHTNIVRIHESGIVDRISYIAAEFVQGQKLQTLDEDGPRFDPRQSAELIAQLADAISHSHAQGVIHRDIKPDNVLLNDSIDASGRSRIIPRLTDFGLARIQDDDTAQSTLGMLVGTVQYMSPEQLQGSSSRTESSTDIYALGILLYEMLTGRRPRPNATNVFQTIDASRMIASPRSLLGNRIPPDINAICMRCLAFDPKSRYPSADELHSDLQRFMDGRPTFARPRSSVQHIVSWCGFHKLAAFTIGAVVSTLAFTVAVFAWTTGQLAGQNEQLKSARASQESAALVAQDHGRRYRNLAWTSNVQRGYSYLEDGRFPAVDQILQGLAQSHPDETIRPEWQLLQHELIRNYRSLYQADFPLREVVRVPHSNWIAFAGDSPTVFVMDISSGEIVARFETEVSQIHALACSRDGQQLAIGGTTAKDSDHAYPWLINLRSGEQTKLNAEGDATIESLSFSHDHQWLAVAYRYENAKLVSLGDPGLNPIEVASGRRGKSIDWLYGTKEAIVHSDHGRLIYRDINQEPRLQDVGVPFLAFAAIPNSNKIALSGVGGCCSVIDGEKNLTLKTLEDARNPPTCIAASEGGQWVAIGLVTGEVIMWDISADDERGRSSNSTITTDNTISASAQARLLDSSTTSMCWFDDDLIAAGEGGRLVLWSPSTTRQMVSSKSGVMAACFDSIDEQIFLGFSDGSLRKYNNDELYRRLLERDPRIEDFGTLLLSGQTSSVTLLKMASSGKWIAAVFADNHLELLDRTGQSIVNETCTANTAEGNAILAVAISNDNRWIAWGGESNELFVRSFDGMKLGYGFTVQPTGDINSVSFFEDGNSIGVSGQFEGVRVYDLNTGEPIRQIGSSSNMAIASMNHAQSIVIGSTEGVIRTLGVDDLVSTQEIRASYDSIGALAVSPCNNIMLSLCDSLDVHVTLLSASTHLGRLSQSPVSNRGGKNLFQAVQFSPDNRYAYVSQGFRDGSYQPTFRLYRLSPLSSSIAEKPLTGSLIPLAKSEH